MDSETQRDQRTLPGEQENLKYIFNCAVFLMSCAVQHMFQLCAFWLDWSSDSQLLVYICFQF
jgi:hypothetical protein